MNSKHKLPLTLLALSTTAAIPAVAHASVPPNFDVSSGSVVTVGGVATSGMVEANSPDALRVPIMSTPLVRYQGAGTQGCDSYARVTHTYSSGTYTGEYESEALCQYVALESDDIVPALWESMGLSQLVWPAGRYHEATVSTGDGTYNSVSSDGARLVTAIESLPYIEEQLFGDVEIHPLQRPAGDRGAACLRRPRCPRDR